MPKYVFPSQNFLDPEGCASVSDPSWSGAGVGVGMLRGIQKINRKGYELTENHIN